MLNRRRVSGPRALQSTRLQLSDVFVLIDPISFLGQCGRGHERGRGHPISTHPSQRSWFAAYQSQLASPSNQGGAFSGSSSGFYSRSVDHSLANTLAAEASIILPASSSGKHYSPSQLHSSEHCPLRTDLLGYSTLDESSPPTSALTR